MSSDQDSPRVVKLATKYLQLNETESREEFLKITCSVEPELRPAILKLASELSDAQTLGSSDSQKKSQRGKTTFFSSLATKENRGIGTFIGPYELTEVLGEGGFGIVYKAIQYEPVQREVALKIIKPGAFCDEVLARFEAERQALALMDHPNIAHVFEAGTSESGHPYFVMELCLGVPLTEYCDQRRLPIKDRLEIFQTVCSALQHAHQRAIIHRDLKPSNILVSEEEGVPYPKVIDFGIAKALNQELTERTLNTAAGNVIGTPQYMSPEQASANPNDIDTRSDVYSLGVILYELVTGTTPIEAKTITKLAFDEILKSIREQDSPKASLRIWEQRTSTTGRAHAKARSTDTQHLRNSVRGELDWILLKALEIDRDRRYESVSALTSDLERYQKDEPVSATPPSRTYLIRKFARRHRGPIWAGTALLTTLVAGIIASLIFAIQANNARKEAEAVSNFLVSAFQSPDPYQDGSLIKVVDILDEASEQIQLSFAENPVIQSRLLDTIGRTYSSLGLNEAAAKLHLANAQILSTNKGPNDLSTLGASHLAGEALQGYGRYKEAVEQLEHVSAEFHRLLGSEDLKTLETDRILATAYQSTGRYNDSIELLNRVISLRKKQLTPNHPDILVAISDLGEVHLAAGNSGEAIQLFTHVANLQRNTEMVDQNNLIQTLSSLARAHTAIGELDRAESIQREAYRICLSRFGENHLATLSTRISIGSILSAQGKHETAAKLMEATVEELKSNLGLQNSATLKGARELASIYSILGWHQDAAAELESVYEISSTLLGNASPETLIAMRQLADARVELKEFDSAASLYSDAMTHWDTSRNQQHPELLILKRNHITLLFDHLEEKEDAIRRQEQLWKLLQSLPALPPNTLLQSRARLAKFYAETGRYEEVIKLLEPITAELAEPETELILAARITHTLGIGYHRTEQYEKAESFLLESIRLANDHFQTTNEIEPSFNPVEPTKTLVAHFRMRGEDQKADAQQTRLNTFLKEIEERKAEANRFAPLREDNSRNMTVRVLIDGTSFLLLKPDQLWLSHESGAGAKPGEHRSRNPTSIDRKEWWPEWNGKITTKLNLPSPIPMDEAGFKLKTEVFAGRGQVTILEQPSKENNYTAKVQMSDVTPDGIRYFSSDWLTFQIAW